MMRWIIGTSMRLQYLVIVIAVVLLFFGVTQLSEMPIDVFPEFDPPLVEVQTEALGLSALEMEALLTVPLEADLLNGVAWLDQIYSETVAGLSSILLVFEEGTDPIRARQMVQERLTQTFALPNVSKPPTMLQPRSSSSRVMAVGLSSTELSTIDMSVLARWNIKPRLLGVPGVANVAIWGQREWQLQVQVDPERLDAEDVTLQEIIRTTGEALWVSPLSYLESSYPGTAGWIDTPNQRLGIQHLLPIASAQELAQVAVVNHEGLRLGDVTNVVEDHQPLIGDVQLDDGPGLLLVIEKFPNANTLEVTQGVEDALKALQPGLTGIDIDTNVFRAANYVDQAIDNVSNQVVISAVLLAIALGLLFFGWRTTLISLFVIPLSLVTASLVLYLRGESFNMMILAGLVMALGVVIDNTITDIAIISRRIREHRQANSGQPITHIIVDAAFEKRGPLFYALLIIILTVLPILTIRGLSGSFLQPLVVTYIITILVSLAVTLIVTPALSLVLLGDVKDGESPLIRGLRSSYDAILPKFINSSSLAIIVVVVVSVIGLVALAPLHIDLLPELKQTQLRIQWDGAPGTSSTEMMRVSSQAISELQSIPGVDNVTSQIGRAITGDQVVGINSAELWVNLAPTASYDETLSTIREVVSGYPGLFREVETFQPNRIDNVLTTQDQDIIVRVYGDDIGILNDKAEELSQVFAQIDGVSAAQTSRQTVEPQVEIEVDLAAAERYQIKPGNVRRAATTLISGLQVGNLYEGQKIFEVVVWGVPELRNSLDDIKNLQIDTPIGQVSLSELADVRIVPATIVIQRDAVQRFVDVSVSPSGGDLGSIITDLQNGIDQVDFPLEFHAEILPEALEQQAVNQSLLGLLVAIVIGIFLLLQATFTSWRLAFVTFLTLPMALAGGAILLIFGDGTLSIGSLFGFLAGLGIAVRSVVLVVMHFKHLEQNEGEVFGQELVLRGVRELVAPRVMSAIAIGLALLPFILAGNIAGNEIVHSMALVILGCLVTTLVLALFALPILYLRFGSSPESSESSSPMTAPPSLETN